MWCRAVSSPPSDPRWWRAPAPAPARPFSSCRLCSASSSWGRTLSCWSCLSRDSPGCQWRRSDLSADLFSPRSRRGQRRWERAPCWCEVRYKLSPGHTGTLPAAGTLNSHLAFCRTLSCTTEINHPSENHEIDFHIRNYNSIFMADMTHFKPMKKDYFPGKPIKTIKSWMSCAKVKLTSGSGLRVNWWNKNERQNLVQMVMISTVGLQSYSYTHMRVSRHSSLKTIQTDILIFLCESWLTARPSQWAGCCPEIVIMPILPKNRWQWPDRNNRKQSAMMIFTIIWTGTTRPVASVYNF